MSAAVTAVKPTYLGRLNAVAEAEMHGYRYFTAWSERTTDPVVRVAVLKVAAREGEHALTFARRVNELGFEVRPRTTTDDDNRRAEVAGSDRSDLEKLEALGYGADWDQSRPDLFDDWFADHSIDPATGQLLGRFIAEERDTSRIMHGAWQDLSARST